MKYFLLMGLLCAGTLGFAQKAPQKVPVTVPVQTAGSPLVVAPSTASPSSTVVDTTYLSSTDFSGTGSATDPIRVKTAVIQSWLQSLPGFTAGGGKYLSSDFTWKAIATATPLPQLSTPSLTATAVSSSAISLSWTDVSNETSYLLQRSQDNASWVTVASPGANITQFTNSGLSPSTLYYFRVKAIGDNTSYTDGSFGWDSKSTLPGGGGGGVVLPETLLFNVANSFQVQDHPDGPGTYYSSQGNGLAQSLKKLPAGADGLVYFQYQAGTGELLSLGYTPNKGLQGYNRWMGGLIITDIEVKAYGWNGSTTGLGVQPVNNHFYGFRRAGTEIEIVTSTDEQTWTVLGYTNYSSEDLYPQAYFQTPTSKIKSFGRNLVSY